MRELKFRVWDKAENKWLFGYEYPNLGGFSLTGEVVLLGEFSHIITLDKLCNDDYAIMQYTGLKDKNGKDIYEGDILGWDVPGKDGWETGDMDRMTVDYDEKLTRFLLHFWSCYGGEGYSGALEHDQMHVHVKQGCFVIGNIHENPELLKS